MIPRLSIKCEKCGEVITLSTEESWQFHNYGKCISRKKCSHCSIVDTVEIIEKHEKTHKNYDSAKPLLKYKLAENVTFKKIEKCRICNKKLTQYASDVCQFCGDK